MAQVLIQDGQGGAQIFLGDGVGHLAQWEVGGYQGNPHSRRGQQHDDLRGSGQFGQKLGVARKGQSSIINDAFVHRARDQRCKFPLQATLGRTP